MNYREKRCYENKDGNIDIYCIDYLFPYIQDILTNMIYKETMNYGKLFFNLFDGQTPSGFFEYFIIEYVKETKRFFEYTINNFETINTIVENNYFIQNHSSRKLEIKPNYIENENLIEKPTINPLKIRLPNNNILISQNELNGKYYDCAFLFPITDQETCKHFRIAVCQISKNKISLQRFFKEEHELILRNVKYNLENKFDIEICEGYFFYIFSSQELDKNSIEFCKENNIAYVLFSPDIMKFDPNYPFDLKSSLITKIFPVQNIFSILPQEKFKMNNNQFIFNNEIQKIKENFIYTKISGENETKLNNYLYQKQSTNEYFILGYFDEKFDVTKFCLWYDKNNREIDYKNGLKQVILQKELKFQEYEKPNFVLIGLKKEILYTGYHSLLEYFPNKND